APIVPEDADPTVRNAVSMAENLKITGADRVQAVAQKRFGAPEMNPWRRFKAALGLAPEEAPQPLIAVVDSGADVTHPLLKRVKEVKNATSGENVDDIGHGSWVTSMVLNYAPWAKNVTHYKTFLNGGATLDDILKALTMAANDGNLVISNSWGSDDGDPTSPDSVLVQKLASEGHIMVFAAGNAGPGANTVGSPAIIQYKDAQTGAIRVLAVAASDRNKKVAFFSSRGPGSPKTKGKDGFAHRPDLMGVGYNTDGAWPAALGDADRTDPVAGPIKAISGTSMSTPSIAGALALLMIVFGVTAKGARLDAVVNAVMSTLEKTGKNSADEEGQGFIDVEAAYELLYKQFDPGQTPPTAVLRYRQLKADAKSIEEYVDPRSEANVLAGQPDAKIVDSMLKDHQAIAAELKALEAEYPAIAHQSAGPVARAWARLTGRAPVPAHVAEYRRLSALVAREEAENRAFRRAAAQQPGKLREEMLARLETEIEPRGDADRAALRALLTAHPHAEYEAAGFFGRLWLRLTGRAPELS
ncbi:MAG: S8 family serine peptidase, partial [Elusimicrobia bacterium]|nr:S8 family serine peptidase [Elusimicrobiota bacterium]